MAEHTIASVSDWSTLAKKGLDTVVDPMVIRCGELFLKGGSGVNDPQQVRSFLSQNVHSLGMFFDSIILQYRIPVFNYGDTYDMGLNFEARTLAAVNRDEPVLVEVDVQYEPYTQIKSNVLAKLAELYNGPPRIKADMANDIIQELGAAEYKWQPGLGDLEKNLPSEQERKLAKFLLGGMIFGAYAQILEGEHVIQPKRSRLFLAVALGAPSARYRFEEELFSELKNRARSSVTDMPWRPTFFPYLLASSNNPEEVLALALALRTSTEVREYREWLRSALKRWSTHGEIQAFTKDIASIATYVDRLTGKISRVPKLEFKFTIADVIKIAGGHIPAPGLDLTPTLQGLWGWLIPNIPGRRYRKVLARAVATDHDFAQLENRLLTVWGD